MIGQTTELLFQILRCGIVLAFAAFVANAVLGMARAKPATKVFAWLLVLLPGWLLLTFTLEVPWYAPVTTQPTAYSSASALPNLFEIVADVPQDSSGSAVESQTVPEPEPPVPVGWTVWQGGIVSLAMIWLVGMLALGVRYIYQYVQMAATVWRLPPLDDPQWQAELENICAAKAVSSTPKLVVSDHWGPALCFVRWRYLLIVPRVVVDHCTADQRTSILQHELTHLERGDLWLAMLGRLLILPQWFNPAAWFAAGRLDESIEMSCDARVLATSELDRFVYIKSLLALVELQNETTPPLHSLATTGAPVKKRIQYLIHPKGSEMKFARTLIISALVGITITAFLRFELVAQTAVKELPPSNSEPAHQIASVAEDLENESSGSTAKEDRVYYVGDLISPIDYQYDYGKDLELFPQLREPDGGITEKDFLPVIDLIQNTIESESWGQGNSIRPYLPNLSLIVSCPQEVHDKVLDLLAKLRELTAVRIHLEYELWVVPKTAEPEFGQVHAAVDDRQFEEFIAEKPYPTVESRKYPMVHGFNGSAFRTWPLDLNDVNLSGLRMQALISRDRSTVNIAVNKFVEKETAETFQHNLGEAPRIASDMEGRSVTEIPNKGFAEIDVTNLIENNQDGCKAVLLVRPTVIIKRGEVKED